MRQQTPFEESLNTWTHALGAISGFIGLFYLISKVNSNNSWHLFSILVYCFSVILLFSASALYHYVSKENLKHKFRILDHISIYILIAGTYTPVVLIALTNSLGWVLFWIVWGIALFGVFLKLFYTGKFGVFSTLLYLVMGWLIIFDFENLAAFIGDKGVFWLYMGGIFYTVGIVFYAVNKLFLNHVIWHVFVLLGAVSHFIMIYNYIL